MATARASLKSLLYISGLFLQLLLIECGKINKPLVPALYVFGSSIVDSGNNNFLDTRAKANFSPYGIDFPSGATGRFTNGRTLADFIAQSLGLPFAPPYLGLSENDKCRLTTGVNYASGSAGILPETGNTLGKILTFDDQIKYFEETVTQYLPRIFKTPIQLSQYLSESILVVAIGTNDYFNNYLQPIVSNISQIFTPEQFGPFLLNVYNQQLSKLYELGARKFVVVNINPLGCLPYYVNNANMQSARTPCVEEVNQLVNIFNRGLRSTLVELEQSLMGSTFVHLDLYGIVNDMIQNPSKCGLASTATPCCEVGIWMSCLPNHQPCKNRNEHLFWDGVHMTQRAHFFVANGSFMTNMLLNQHSTS